jgi:L-ascorbate metabolism protein UlaG (beta-lactamase superfamily)
VICHDGRPVFCTDPWLHRAPYFCSWTHNFRLSERQIADILACEYIWFCHGHPNHLVRLDDAMAGSAIT